MIHLYDYCIDYLENTNEKNLNSTIYDNCFDYLSGNYTAKQKESLEKHFNII